MKLPNDPDNLSWAAFELDEDDDEQLFMREMAYRWGRYTNARMDLEEAEARVKNSREQWASRILVHYGPD